MDEQLAERRQWFDQFGSQIAPGNPYSCPCCGYPTLPSRAGNDICELCDWEDDGQDDSSSDEVRGGPNGQYSLTEARENFKAYGAMYRPEGDPRIIKGDNDAQWAAKQGLIRAFEAIRAGGKEDSRSLSAEIESCRQILRAEAVKKIRRYERNMQPRTGTDG